MLFLHGYMSKKESFYYQLKSLKRYFRVVAPDLNGFGESPRLECAWSLSDYAKSVGEFIEQLRVTRLHIVAHSFGARIALKMLPGAHRVDKLVLTGAAGIKPKFSFKRSFNIALYKVLKKVLPPNKLAKFGSSDYKQLDGAARQSFVKIVNEHLDKKLPLITNNTLIICGDKDKETPLYMAKKLHRGIKNSQLYVMENVGHFAFIDKPREFNALVKDFLLK